MDTGPQAEVARYIGGHLAEVQGRADTLFKGETSRSILLNANGWDGSGPPGPSRVQRSNCSFSEAVR